MRSELFWFRVAWAFFTAIFAAVAGWTLAIETADRRVVKLARSHPDYDARVIQARIDWRMSLAVFAFQAVIFAVRLVGTFGPEPVSSWWRHFWATDATTLTVFGGLLAWVQVVNLRDRRHTLRLWPHQPAPSRPKGEA